MMSSVSESGGNILDYAKQVDIGIIDCEVNKDHPGTTVQPKMFLRKNKTLLNSLHCWKLK